MNISKLILYTEERIVTCSGLLLFFIILSIKREKNKVKFFKAF